MDNSISIKLRKSKSNRAPFFEPFGEYFSIPSEILFRLFFQHCSFIMKKRRKNYSELFYYRRYIWAEQAVAAVAAQEADIRAEAERARAEGIPVPVLAGQAAAPDAQGAVPSAAVVPAEGIPPADSE